MIVVAGLPCDVTAQVGYPEAQNGCPPANPVPLMVMSGLLSAYGAKNQLGEIELSTIGAIVTVMFADADLVESFVDVAVQLADPAAVGVNTPEEVIVPSVAV